MDLHATHNPQLTPQHSLPPSLLTTHTPPTNHYQRKLKHTDFEPAGCLTPKQASLRYNLLIQLIPTCLKSLELKPKTVDIGVRMFDYFCMVRHEGRRQQEEGRRQQEEGRSKGQKRPRAVQAGVLQSKGYAESILVTCLFLAAKYNEIYPPGLNDFLAYAEITLSKEQELQLEKEILLATDFGFTLATAYEWYRSLLGERYIRFPEWALMLYCHSLLKAEHLARAVIHVQTLLHAQALFHDQALFQKQQPQNSKCLEKALEVLGLKKKRTTSHKETVRNHSAPKRRSQ